MQALVYLPVKQSANVIVHEAAFSHIHALSYHWHTSKKTGSILRILDRGGSACDSLVSYLFLSLVPGVMESIAVLLIFVFRFDWTISIIVCIGVSLYVAATRSVTVQRKKFRFDPK
jgi:ABC-type transport system involved in Fe-S cluster assembly fused permease/ATPase subunit